MTWHGQHPKLFQFIRILRSIFKENVKEKARPCSKTHQNLSKFFSLPWWKLFIEISKRIFTFTLTFNKKVSFKTLKKVYKSFKMWKCKTRQGVRVNFGMTLCSLDLFFMLKFKFWILLDVLWEVPKHKTVWSKVSLLFFANTKGKQLQMDFIQISLESFENK